MRLNEKEQGFTLLEILVVLVLMVPIMLAAAKLLSMQSQTSSMNTLIVTEAQELVALQNAAQQYITQVDSGWTAGIVNTLGIQAMITANLLPAGFANRNGAIGTAPLFQTYSVLAMLSSTDNNPRIVITLSGNPAPGRLSRYGMTQSIADLQGFNQEVAEKVQAINNNTYSGVIAGGVKVVTGNYGAFTEDVSALLATAPNYPTAAVLYGYPDLGPTQVNNPGASQYKACTIMTAGTGVQPTCASGWKQLAAFPFCGASNNNYTLPIYQVYGSAVGDITLASVEDKYSYWATYYQQSGCAPGTALPSPPGGTCPPSPNNTYRASVNKFTQIQDNDILLNGAVIQNEYNCVTYGYTQYSMNVPNGSCGYSAQGGYPCVYADTTYNGAIAILKNAQDILCCLPN